VITQRWGNEVDMSILQEEVQVEAGDEQAQDQESRFKVKPGQTAGLNFNTRATTSLTLSSQDMQIPLQVLERRNCGGRVFSHTRHFHVNFILLHIRSIVYIQDDDN